MPTKYRVRISNNAEKDIEEIWTYISADSPERAIRFIYDLENQLETLESLPQRCPLIPENEFLGLDHRHLLLGNCRAIFRVRDYTVIILRVIHGARLLDASLLESDPS